MQPTPTLAAVLLAGIASAAPVTPQEGTQFLRALPEVGELLSGETLAYRYRRVEFHTDGEHELPERIHEGVARIEFRDTGFYTYDMQLQDAPEDAEFGIAFRERTFHSYTTGEYARAARMPGAHSDRVVIERWRGLPRLTYLALGLVGAPAAFLGARPGGIRQLEHGLEEARWIAAGGKVLTFTYDPAPPGRLLRAESRASDGAFAEVYEFSGHVPGIAGLPDRPTLIVDARVGRDGAVQFVSVWQALDQLSSDDGFDDRVEANALVANLRLSDAQRVDQATDRDLRLEQLLTDPSALARPHEVDALEIDPDALVPEESSGSGRRGLAWLDVGLLASAALIFGAVIVHKRSA